VSGYVILGVLVVILAVIILNRLRAKDDGSDNGVEETCLRPLADPLSGYFRAERERRERHQLWSWFNSVYLKGLNDNPPSERYRILRGADGRWYVDEYRGARSYSSLYSMGYYVPEGPDGYHHFDVIGEMNGFLYREEAERYLAAHIADQDKAATKYAPAGALIAPDVPTLEASQ
jgi:hypothetical protein